MLFCRCIYFLCLYRSVSRPVWLCGSFALHHCFVSPVADFLVDLSGQGNHPNHWPIVCLISLLIHGMHCQHRYTGFFWMVWFYFANEILLIIDYFKNNGSKNVKKTDLFHKVNLNTADKKNGSRSVIPVFNWDSLQLDGKSYAKALMIQLPILTEKALNNRNSLSDPMHSVSLVHQYSLW